MGKTLELFESIINESNNINSGLVVCDRCLKVIRNKENIKDFDIEKEIPDRYIEAVDNDTGTEFGYCMWCNNEFEVSDLFYIKPDNLEKSEELK